jgi:8-oxo-dGTP pyrophosphatase MutT (NUDIX family)
MNSDAYKNYKSYKVLWAGKCSPEDITIKITDEKPKTNPIINKSVDQHWEEFVKGRKSVGLESWESNIYGLFDYQTQNNKLILTLGTVSFKYNQGTNATSWILGDIFGTEYLAKTILVQTIVYTKDGLVVLGRRRTGVKDEYEPYAIFGGTADKDGQEGLIINNSHDFFATIKRELREELGLKDEHISSISLTHLFEDYKYYQVFLFQTHTNLTTEELQDLFEKKGNKFEHSRVEIMKLEEANKLTSRSPEKFNELTLSAVHILTDTNL